MISKKRLSDIRGLPSICACAQEQNSLHSLNSIHINSALLARCAMVFRQFSTCIIYFSSGNTLKLPLWPSSCCYQAHQAKARYEKGLVKPLPNIKKDKSIRLGPAAVLKSNNSCSDRQRASVRQARFLPAKTNTGTHTQQPQK